MHWDNSISLGTIVTLTVFVVSIFSMHAANVRRMQEMSTQLEQLLDWYKAWIAKKWESGD